MKSQFCTSKISSLKAWFWIKRQQERIKNQIGTRKSSKSGTPSKSSGTQFIRQFDDIEVLSTPPKNKLSPMQTKNKYPNLNKMQIDQIGTKSIFWSVLEY